MKQTTNQLDYAVFAATLLAVFSVELADLGWQPLWWVIGKAIVVFVAALAVRAGIQRWARPVGPVAWERLVAGVVVAGVLYRLLVWPVPTEWLAIEALRNAVVAMVALATTRRIDAVVMGVSLALVLVCSVVGENIGVLLTAVGFAAVGAAWLAKHKDADRPLPWGALAAVVLMASCVGWIVQGGATVRFAGLLPGLVSSSGGEGRGDELSRSGLGDGPDQQAGANGDAGFDRSDLFCETDGQCLYDAFVEAYGELPQSTKQDKVQWLGLQEEQIAAHRERDLRNGREQKQTRSFGLRREKRAGREHSPDAVLWLEADRGQFPMRLPVLAFDHYHGEHWHEESDQSVISAMDNAGEDGWFTPIDQPVGGVWGDEQTVAVSTGTYDGNVLPIPGGLTSFRMGQSRRADLFANAAEPMLRVNRQRLPAGSIVDVRYRPAVQSLLAGAEFAGATVDKTHVHPSAAQLAEEWAGHLPRGWAQIDAVVSGLRRYATFDENAVGAVDQHDHGCPVEVFLHDTRRGDAHLFASAAVLMLQSLDYDTRLAGGYYADAGAIDTNTGKAIVQRRHAHVWPQIRLAAEAGVVSSRGNAFGIARGGQWIDLEPTPGFAVAQGVPTLSQRAGTLWSSILAGVVRNRVVLVGVAGVLVLLFVMRVPLANQLDRWVWKIRPCRNDRELVLRTLALLDRRAHRRGQPRPRSMTFARWVVDRRLARAANWALHAPSDTPAPNGTRDACRAAVLQTQPTSASPQAAGVASNLQIAYAPDPD